MEPIASSGKVEEGGETIEGCDTEKEIEQSLVGTLRAKWIAMKRVIEDQLLQHCSDKKLHRIRAYQVWPGKNVHFACQPTLNVPLVLSSVTEIVCFSCRSSSSKGDSYVVQISKG